MGYGKCKSYSFSSSSQCLGIVFLIQMQSTMLILQCLPWPFCFIVLHLITALARQSVSILLHVSIACARYAFKMSHAQLDDAVDVEEEILQVNVIL
jgi:hypothetical protein